MPSQSQQKKHQNKGQWSGSVEFIVNFEYMERLVPIADFEQVNVCWVGVLSKIMWTPVIIRV